jgi:hypothetical protein
MRQGKSYFVIALAALATLSLSTASYSHGWFRAWWFRPPAPAIADVAFVDGAAEHGSVKVAVVTNSALASYTKTDLVESTFQASVAGGILTIDSISLASEDGNTNVTVTLDPATLRRNIFNSSFSAEGTAVVDVTDPASSTSVPVAVCGFISQRNSEYVLRAAVRGLTSADDGAGTVTYTLFKLGLEAEATVP